MHVFSLELVHGMQAVNVLRHAQAMAVVLNPSSLHTQISDLCVYQCACGVCACVHVCAGFCARMWMLCPIVSELCMCVCMCVCVCVHACACNFVCIMLLNIGNSV